MPFQPRKKRQEELARKKHEEEARAEKLQEADLLEDPGLSDSESDNLVVVEGVPEDMPPAPPSHALHRLSLARVLGASKSELLAIGLDRGYWKSTGRLSLLSESAIREAFYNEQSKDTRLSD